MATVVLAAAGAAIGGQIGRAVLGVSAAAIGRAIGAGIGQSIDQRLLGGGSAAVETGRIDRLRLQTAGEGFPIAQIWGQMRVPGHVIWASPLQESRQRQGGGRGAAKIERLGYRISVALALCEGRISGVGRIWADGEEVAASDLNMRVYRGGAGQFPDPVIAAYEGTEAPAYRGLAYVVLEDVDLARWNNRLPQLSFEVTRPAQDQSGMAANIAAVAMIPGTGEYALATSSVTYDLGLGERGAVNVSSPMGGTDFNASLETLGHELPKVESVSLVVSLFGDDLRIGQCRLCPKVEQRGMDGSEMPWVVSGVARDEAGEIAQIDGRPAYGGSPCDQSVVEALRAITASGRRAVFYPFILMEQLPGNGLPDPYGGAEQAVQPWRGRITVTDAARGTAEADAEIAAFFGRAKPEDFRREGMTVHYHGPEEWSYRRFILHYAQLCALAGGVDAFLIGSEMVGMTQIRGAAGYPAVDQLRRLAADVRAILGPDVKISYAADWSEYSGHQPGGGERFFHLDPLWADENIDFIGIDNYMPLTDWRDGRDHLDGHWRRIDNPDYLLAGVAGGEGYDWYYPSDADREAQRRIPITDGAYDEAWVWRYKDIRSWWQNLHYDRPDGVRATEPTGWVPESKPIWFTEFGCAAIDKGTNQPNKFLDARSSEGGLPYYSDGRRDDALQAAYIRAVLAYWDDPANNPAMEGGGRMVDTDRAHVWCWDARPYPVFPGRIDLWSDGPAWARGHWLNGRAGAVALGSVVGDICRDAGVEAFDVSDLTGVVRGYHLRGDEVGRAALQPLMLAYGFDAVERDGVLRFIMRDAQARVGIEVGDLALRDGSGAEFLRDAWAEIPGRVRLSHLEAGGDYATVSTEAALPGEAAIAASEIPLLLTRGEGQAIAERWLSEVHISRDRASFALPPSMAELGPGDVVQLRRDGAELQNWRIDRMEQSEIVAVEATRVEPELYYVAAQETPVSVEPYIPPLPVWPVFLDLPLLRGDEIAHAPYLAVTGQPWPGAVAAYVSTEEEGGFDLNLVLEGRALIGRTMTALRSARSGMIDRGPALRVRIKGGALQSVTERALLAGANLLAIGDGSSGNWEVMQFATAETVGDGVWEISGRLRGQAGTDAVMPDVWPEGSLVVLMDGAPQQVTLPPDARGQERFWRVGPAARGPGDGSYQSVVNVAVGIGLRPYAPCHLRQNGRSVSWVRRTRVGGDDWGGFDVPVGEAQERYLLRLSKNGKIFHEAQTDAPKYIIPTNIQLDNKCYLEVAQISDGYGPGAFARRMINAD